MDQIEEFISHYGKKGMRWGQRKGNRGSKESKRSKREPGKIIPKAKDLSDEQLRAAVNRIQLERQYNSLVAGKSPSKKVATFVGNIGSTAVKTAVTALATQQVGAALKKIVTKKSP